MPSSAAAVVRLSPVVLCARTLATGLFILLAANPAGASGTIPDQSVMFGASPGATARTVGGGRDGVLLRIDELTGHGREIGDIGRAYPATGVRALAGLACAGDGTLWGSLEAAGCGAIVTIDRLSGTAQRVGYSGYCKGVTAIAFAPDATIYGSVKTQDGVGADALVTISGGNGAATLVGSYGSGIAWMDGLAFQPVTGVLYGIGYSDWADLYIIDTLTGAASLVGAIRDAGGAPVPTTPSGMAFREDGSLFASTEEGELLAIDPLTGIYTVVGPVGGTEAFVSDIAFCILNAVGVEALDIAPSRVTNEGPLSATVYVPGVEAGATVRLEHPDGSVIAGTDVLVDAAGHRLGANFDLAGAPDGVWDVLVENPGGPGGAYGDYEPGRLSRGLQVEDPDLPQEMFGAYPHADNGLATLLRIDEASGLASIVGDIAFQSVSGIDCDAGGTLWGSLGSIGGGSIIHIDRFSGVAALVGESGVAGGIPGLAIADDGSIYGSANVGCCAETLVRIDPATGAATVVGTYGTGVEGVTGIAFDAGGTLYGVTNFFDWMAGAPALYTIDTDTAEATLVGPLVDRRGRPIDFAPTGLRFRGDGRLFASTRTRWASDLVTIDPATAVFSYLGSAGAAYAPIVSDLAFCAVVQAPDVFAVTPPTGGNRGTVEIIVYHGMDLAGGAQVRLVCDGQDDILATSIDFTLGPNRLRVTFDLTSALPGTCDIVVVATAEPDDPGTLADAFVIEDHGLELLSVAPGRGGDAGVVTVAIRARHAPAVASVKLLRPGDEIVGTDVLVGTDDPGTGMPATIHASFDLTGRASGAWDVVVGEVGAPPPGNEDTLPAAFTIEAAKPARMTLDIVGSTRIRTLRNAVYTFLAGNEGNVDARGVLFVYGVPEDATVDARFPDPISPSETFSVVAISTAHGPAWMFSAVRIPPGAERRFVLRFAVPTARDFSLEATLGDPWPAPLEVMP